MPLLDAAQPRRRPRAWLALAVVTVALAAALGGLVGTPPGTPTPAAAAAPKTVTIDIKNFAYSKKTVTIRVGQRIKWVNRDEHRHNAYSSKSGGPKGPLLGKGKSWTWTAKKAGTFSYYCTPHTFMKGKIVVKK